jgi:FkbM family methyltransferase
MFKRAAQFFGNAVTVAVNAAGFELIPTWRMEQRDFAMHLGEILRKLDVEVVIDVGANLGQYGDFLRKQVGYSGKILSVEPIREIADALERHAAADSNWRTFRGAVGSYDGEADLNVAQSSKLSSFLKPVRVGSQIFDENNVAIRTERVPILRLDSLLRQFELDPVRQSIYLKLDTQGYDFEIMKSSAETVRELAGMQTELSLVPLYAAMPSFSEVLTWVQGQGFDVTGMYSVGRDDALRVMEMDCVLGNRRRLSGGVLAGPGTSP